MLILIKYANRRLLTFTHTCTPTPTYERMYIFPICHQTGRQQEEPPTTNAISSSISMAIPHLWPAGSGTTLFVEINIICVVQIATNIGQEFTQIGGVAENMCLGIAAVVLAANNRC